MSISKGSSKTPINISHCLLIHLSVHLSSFPSSHLFTHQSVCPLISPFHPSIYPSIHTPIPPSIHLSFIHPKTPFKQSDLKKQTVNRSVPQWHHCLHSHRGQTRFLETGSTQAPLTPGLTGHRPSSHPQLRYSIGGCSLVGRLLLPQEPCWVCVPIPPRNISISFPVRGPSTIFCTHLINIMAQNHDGHTKKRAERPYHMWQHVTMHAACAVPAGRHHMRAHRLRLPGKWNSALPPTHSCTQNQEKETHTHVWDKIYIYFSE